MSLFPARILLATDGSRDAALASSAATSLSRETGAELHVVHVVDIYSRYAYPAITPDVYALVSEEKERAGGELLAGELERVRGGGARDAVTHLKKGSAVEEILDVAGEIDAGLIVLGSRGLGPVRRLVMGSVSDGVAHDARSPVLVMRGDEGVSWPPRRIVLGDDGSEEARAAEEVAAGLCKLYGSQALLVRSYPKLPEQDIEGRGFDARAVDDALRREEQDLKARASELQDSFGVRPKIRLSEGDPAGCLLEAARGEIGEEAGEGSLLAVGSRGLDAVARLRLGSVSTKLLHAARGPVLIYRRTERNPA